MQTEVYTLIRSNRKTLSLSVTAQGELVARAPRHMPRGAIDRFVAEKAGWIAGVRAKQAQRPAASHSFLPGDVFLFAGEPLTLGYARVKRPTLWGNALLVPEGTPGETRARLEKWYRESARELFFERTALYAPVCGVQPGHVRLSSARTRWGSCGREGINLNWRLVMAPMELVDYVVIHELCHLLHHDHSPAFWAQVERVLPDCKARRKALKDSGGLYEWPEM